MSPGSVPESLYSLHLFFYFSNFFSSLVYHLFMSYETLITQKQSFSTIFESDEPDQLLSNRRHTLANCTFLNPLGIPDQEETFKHTNSLKLLHHNVRSIVKNGTRFEEFLFNSNLTLSCILITETWLNDTLPVPVIANFKFSGTHRQGRNGGGVGIFVNNMLSFKIRNDLSHLYQSLEFHIIELDRNPSKNVIVCCIYRPPDSNMSTFLLEIQHLISKLLSERKIVFIGGDFNIDLIQYNSDPVVTQFVDVLLSYNLYPTISRPTRVSKTSSTLLDCIFTNSIEPASSAIIIENTISDHYPILLSTELTDVEKSNVPTVNYNRKITSEMATLFNEKLVDEFCSFQNFQNASDATDFFCNVITSNIDTYFPIKRSCRKTQPLKPWISQGILASINTKNNLYKSFLQRRSDEALMRFKTYKNRLLNVIRAAKKKHYQNLIAINTGNSKETWKILNEIIGSTKNKTNIIKNIKIGQNITTNSKDISNELNNFFTSIGANIEQELPPSSVDPTAYIQYDSLETCFLNPVTPESISVILRELKVTGGGIDPISSKVLKILEPSICVPLSHIVNLCFITGCFPDSLKVSTVTPIFKCGEKSDAGNYRPISVLSPLSKIIEKCIYHRICSYLNYRNILADNQYGFRTSHSTEHALLNFIDHVSQELDKGKYVIGIYLDIKKAFDSVNFNILYKKLTKYGIRGISLDLIKSYLTNRKQRVKLTEETGKTVFSEFRNVTCGVPQGSVLGPLLFLLYVNDLKNVSTEFRIITFADDTNLFMSHSNLQHLCEKSVCELEKLRHWFLCNRLCLNVSKTSFQIYTKKKLSLSPVIQINNVNIKREKTVKFLGILVDENLTFQEHINYVCQKLSAGIGIMFRGKDVLESTQLKLLYNTLLLPHLTYCNLVWGINFESYTQRILLLQKRAARVILGLGYNESVLHKFSNIGLTPFMDILNLKSMIMVYKVKNNIAPPQVHHLLCWREPNSNHRELRNNNLLEIPYSRTAYKQRTFRVYASKLCNKLNSFSVLKFDIPISAFKTQIKNLLRLSDDQADHSY